MSQPTQPGTFHRLLVLGFGVTGRAVCDFAIRHTLSAYVSEQSRMSEEQRNWLRDNGIGFEQSGHTTRFLPDVDVVVLSPGIPPEHPILEAARQQGVPVLSEIDLALSLVRDCTVVAVTGTNGKSSTVEVIGMILQSLGKRAWVAGNIGVPLISLVGKAQASDVLVLELSSYQLEQSPGFRPHIGVLLNLSPDHMHRHGDMQSYANAKAKMFANQQPEDVAILPSVLASQFAGGHGRRVFYDQLFGSLPAGTESLLPHERSNLRAAFAACEALLPDFDMQSIPMQSVCKTFRLPHRMEALGQIGGVRIVNDSKSTNAGSTIAALRSVDSPAVLLLGGRYKGAGYESLVDEIAASDIRQVILFGEAADTLRGVFERRARGGLAPVSVRTLQDAVDRGIRVARPGDVLLLSPACSSFDAFANYAERGEAFAALIRSYPGFETTQPRT